MRFKAGLDQSPTFVRLVASLSTLGAVAWFQLSDNAIRVTIIPEQGTQVWSVLSTDALFSSYSVQSAVAGNTINLEVPLAPLLRALRSATTAGVTNASIRLTKTAAGTPALVVSITQSSAVRHDALLASSTGAQGRAEPRSDDNNTDAAAFRADRETLVTQTVPIRVIPVTQVANLHEPRCREPDVNILLPPLAQLKAVSDRFARLAGPASGARAPKLELAATMHGSLRLSLAQEALRITSTWRDLTIPELRADAFADGEASVAAHPSTLMRKIPESDEAAWAAVRVDARDWSRVLAVGRLGGRVIACFCKGHALILYVYLTGESELVEEDGEGSKEENVLTYYVSSYSL